MNTKRGPAKGVLKEHPIHPKVVTKILRMRRKNMTFREISEALKPQTVMTPMGVHYLYRRWEHWVE